jgi:hypothetical protein
MFTKNERILKKLGNMQQKYVCAIKAIQDQLFFIFF